MKSGSAELLLARGFLATRPPSGAFPASGLFLGGFAFGFRTRPVAFVTFAGLALGLRTLPPIRGQGSADIVGLNEGRAQLVAADIPFIGTGVDQLSFAGHYVAFEQLGFGTSSLSGALQCSNFLSLVRQPDVALVDHLTRLLRSMRAGVSSLIQLEESIS